MRNKVLASVAAALAIAAGLGLATSSNAQNATLYAFPLSDSDMSAREFAITGVHAKGIQGFGYDIGVVKWRPGKPSNWEEQRWSRVKDGVTKDQFEKTPQNNQSEVYKKPIYAMADGVVEGCWRNTEENPRPFSSALGDSFTTDGKPLKEDNSNATKCEDSPWLHPKLCTGEMAGGGNHIWIKQTDGKHALYAHMITGSIPSAICPHDDKFFKTAYKGYKSPDIAPEVAVTNGATIKKGQFLGYLGNSGSSSGPHLHVHMEKDGVAQPINFEHGLSAPFIDKTQYNDDNADVTWKPFAGMPVPVVDGQSTLVWPARFPTAKFNRNGVEAKLYQGLFTHLADSGMWPGLVTCKVNDGKVFYDLINWEKAPAGANWYGLHGLSDQKLKAEIDKAKKNGYKWTSSYTCKGDGVSNSVIIFKK